MSDNPSQTKPPILKVQYDIEKINSDLKEICKEMKSLKNDISYIKRNIDKWVKDREEKQIRESQAKQEGWFLPWSS